jgi:hypothetical protein
MVNWCNGPQEEYFNFAQIGHYYFALINLRAPC